MELFLQNSKDLRMSSRGSSRHSHWDYSVIAGVFHMEDWTARRVFSLDTICLWWIFWISRCRIFWISRCGIFWRILVAIRPVVVLIVMFTIASVWVAPAHLITAIIFVKLCQFIYLPLFESGGPCFAHILIQSDRGFLKSYIRGSNFDFQESSPDVLDWHNRISEIIHNWIRLQSSAIEETSIEAKFVLLGRGNVDILKEAVG